MTYDDQFKGPLELSFDDKIKHITHHRLTNCFDESLVTPLSYIPANVHVMRWNIVVNKKSPVYAVSLEGPENVGSPGRIILFYNVEEAFKAADMLCEKYRIPMTTYNVERPSVTTPNNIS